ncbi:MAG: sigma-54-dependent transcriptional regulator [Candidatus Methylomirabilales bacterium]
MAGARVLVVDDDAEMVRLLDQELTANGLEVVPATSGAAGMRALRETDVDAVVSDLRMADFDGMDILRAAAESQPEAKVIIITAYASIPSAIEAVKQGAFDYVSKPFEIDELILALKRALEDTRLRHENYMLRREVELRYGFGNLVGASRRMQEVFTGIRAAAQGDLNVLITGESGTGKEVVAKAIHYNSARRKRPFVALNCAAIPETLLESELFGHVRGAFTGASATRRGLIEEAREGTLFLDEVSEMPIALQAKLLRVLEDREVRPLGSNRSVAVEFRVIASTNRDPRAEIEAGTFRADLYYRLNVVEIALPPLRDRRGDLPLLVRHFVNKFAAEQRRPIRGLTQEAMALLESYRWPGNVRELENALERAVAFATSDLITPRDLPPALAEHGDVVELGAAQAWSLQEVEERYIDRILRLVGGDRDRAAEILKVHPRTLQRREMRLGKIRPSSSSHPSPDTASE